jgi:hypothetical protein
MSIPTHHQWMQDTSAGVLTRRSAKLKAVDDAIFQYGKTRSDKDLWRIKNVFEEWKRYKGPSWQASERNRAGAVRRLDDELNSLADYRTYQSTHFSMGELVALSVVAKERKKVIATVFKDKQLTLKATKLKDQLQAMGPGIKHTAEEAASYLKSIGKHEATKMAGPYGPDVLRRKMEEMVQSFFGVSGLEQLGALGGVIISILGQCAVSIPPVVGHIKDGYDLFTGWAQVGADLYHQYNISERRYAIEAGAPSVAFDGLKACLKAETKNQAVSASQATTSFALKTGLAFVDGGAISGPVVGAANALAEFAHNLYLLGTEYRATQAVNQALDCGQLDLRLFRTYPLMGCYMLVSATLSDLIPVESFGTPGWMEYIENMKKHAFDEIYGAAEGLIGQSPWEIEGLPKQRKGTSAGMFTEAKRLFSTVSPLGDLKELIGLAS